VTRGPAHARRKSDAQDDIDAIDFKPFFDMVVGVLFVLLILISAQLFFSQWGTSQDSAKDEADQLPLAWEEEQRNFLEGLASALRRRGLESAVDLVDRSVVLPLKQVVAAQPDGRPRLEQQANAALAEVLLQRLRCLEASQAGKNGCPQFKLLILGQLKSEVRLRGQPSAFGYGADRYAHLLSTLMSASLLQNAPELLAWTGAGGGPALRFGSSIAPAAASADPSLEGELVLRFAFEKPPSVR
jgi:hypothetical protein